MVVEPSGTSPLSFLRAFQLSIPLNPLSHIYDSTVRYRNSRRHHTRKLPMSAGFRTGIAASMLILLLISGIPMKTEAGDADRALVVQRRPPGSSIGSDGIRTTTASQTSTPNTQPATQECDGQAPPAGALTTFLQRVVGRQRPTDVPLCAVPPDIDTAEETHKQSRLK